MIKELRVADVTGALTKIGVVSADVGYLSLVMNNLGMRTHSRKEMCAMLRRRLAWSLYKASV